MKLNPHLDTLAFDGAWSEREGELEWTGLGHLQTTEVAAVLERTIERIERHLRRSGRLPIDEEEDARDPSADPEANLAASAVSGQAPPAGPQWMPGLAPLDDRPLAIHKPLCVAMCGFTLHAATRAGGGDPEGREALLRYVLRPPLGQDRLELRPDGSVRIHLKRPFADGTLAVDMDPLSLLCRLAAAVPPPRYHTVRYAGVLAAASPWRSRIAPPPPPDTAQRGHPSHGPLGKRRHNRYRPWAQLLRPSPIPQRKAVDQRGVRHGADHSVRQRRKPNPDPTPGRRHQPATGATAAGRPEPSGARQWVELYDRL